MKTLCLLIFCLLSVLSTANSVAADKWNIAVISNGSDSVGAQFVSAVKDKIRTSQTYKLGDVGLFTVIITTADPGVAEDEVGLNTAAAIAITMLDVSPKDGLLQSQRQIFLNSTLFFVGKDSINAGAQNVITFLSQNINSVIPSR